MRCVITTEGFGDMVFDLFPDLAPAGTQFFVVHKDAHKLDGRYAAFGEMSAGFEVLDAIAKLPTYGAETWNKPVEMPVITRIVIEE